MPHAVHELGEELVREVMQHMRQRGTALRVLRRAVFLCIHQHQLRRVETGDCACGQVGGHVAGSVITGDDRPASSEQIGTLDLTLPPLIANRENCWLVSCAVSRGAESSPTKTYTQAQRPLSSVIR